MARCVVVRGCSAPFHGMSVPETFPTLGLRSELEVSDEELDRLLDPRSMLHPEE